MLAALNPPNIAAISWLEKTPDLPALVVELVAGKDLAGRLTRGTIPIDEALAIATQIADGLGEAHEKGIARLGLPAPEGCE